ncbi:MAG: calcium/sodium antiporter [Candidatus Diapherotrites archaeon]|nr:calcium/sodium antiporter [Candidatus Diapherotrites archaeon]
MDIMMLTIFGAIFATSLWALVRSSDYFTDSAEKIGILLGIPPFIIGVTLVSLVTSFPELTASIFATLNGNTEIVPAIVIGSNITNICLVLGIAVILNKKLKLSYEITSVDLPILLGSTFLFALAIMDGIFTFAEAIIFIAGAMIYVNYTLSTLKEHKDTEIKKELKGMLKKQKLTTKDRLYFVISAIIIFVSAQITIYSLIELSQIINIGTELIAITAMALGTSLPELMVTTTAAKKGKSEIAVGNVLGSNIFNTFTVIAIPALIMPLTIPKILIETALPMLVAVTFLFFFITQDKELTKWEGGLFILFYIFFIGKMFALF